MPTLYIFNTTICTTPGLVYHTRLVSEPTAREILARFAAKLGDDQQQAWLSAIGHEATAQVATSVLGVKVPTNRIAAEMQTGDEAICIKLRGRAPEGVVLAREQMDEIGYDIIHMLATGTTSPAAVELSRWADPDSYYNWPNPPPLDIEFSTPIVLRRLEEEQAEKVKAQLAAGISYMGGDPAGMLRVSMLTMLRKIVHEHLDRRVTEIRREGLHNEGRRVTDTDLRSIREGLVARLLDQIGEHGEQVECGYGEHD